MMEHAPQVPQPASLLITVEEAAKLLKIGKTKMYELIRNEDLPVVRFGKVVRIDMTDLQAWLKTWKEEQEQ